MDERIVIGIGNELRGDDAAGLEVARLLRGMLPPEIAVVENEGDPAELIESWSGADLAIVIDTMVSGAPPGTVRRYVMSGDVQWTLPTPRHGSSHALGIADAVALGRILRRLPRELVLYTVEGADFGLGVPVAPAVRQAVGKLAETVAQLLSRPARRDDGCPTAAADTPPGGEGARTPNYPR